MVSFDGGLQAKSITSQRNRAQPSQDSGYALLWQRYDNNKMVAMRYYGNVILHLQQYSHILNLLYVFSPVECSIYNVTFNIILSLVASVNDK